MTMLNPTFQTIGRDGVTPSWGAANADGYAIPCDGKSWLEVKNTDGSPITVYEAIPATYDGLAVTPKSVTVAATSGDKAIGPFNDTYRQPGGTFVGKALVTFSAVTAATVCFLRLP